MSAKDYFKKSVWESFTANNGITVDFMLRAIIAMAVAIILGIIIYNIYHRNFGGVVYSNTFAMTLVGMTVLTCGLTLAISSNVIISLGMVGALSIVRYRTAIKDPIDLLYLFWSISIGIMVAADLYVLAIITMVAMYVLIKVFTKKRRIGNIYILVAHYTGEDAGDQIVKIIGKMRYQVKSITVRGEQTELTAQIYSKTDNVAFVKNIQDVKGVADVSLIQYNGEYNG